MSKQFNVNRAVANDSSAMEIKGHFKNGTIEKGKLCPYCGSTNTDCRNGIWYCYECQKEGF